MTHDELNDEVHCIHASGSCPWACEGYVNYCVAENQNPTSYYSTKVLTEVAKQKEDYLVTAFENVGINPNIIIEQDALINKLQSQLNAVRELHTPTDRYFPNLVWGSDGEIDMGGATRSTCKCGSSSYPCLTIQAIEKELK